MKTPPKHVITLDHDETLNAIAKGAMELDPSCPIGTMVCDVNVTVDGETRRIIKTVVTVTRSPAHQVEP